MFAALLFCFWPLRLPRYYLVLGLLYGAWLVLVLYSVGSAQLAKWADKPRPSKWWFAATLPLGLLILHFVGSAVTRASGFRSFAIPSTAMEKTVMHGDHLVADMRYYASRLPARGEVILFEKDHTVFMMRVIGAWGDTVEGRDRKILVNGKEAYEPYAQQSAESAAVYPLEWMRTFGPFRVPDDAYFVMGDNRDVSLDSRSPEFGFVNRGWIVGKPLYVFQSKRGGAKIQ